MINIKKLANDIYNLLSKQKGVLIIIKGSPDPDVIASSYFIKLICDKLNIKSKIIAFQHPSLNSNLLLLKKFNIPITFVEENSINNLENFSGYVILDYQSATVEQLYNKIPCIIHIDHHTPIENDIDAEIRFITEEISSISTLFALFINELTIFNNNEIQDLASLFYIGMRTDSNNFQQLTNLDIKALNFIKQHYNYQVVKQIEQSQPSKHLNKLVKIALRKAKIFDNWFISGIGFIDENERDIIALIADNILNNLNYHLVVIFAAVYHNNRTKLDIDASFRSNDENLDIDALIKRITSNGGGRKFKGAFQIHIDYFLYYPNKNKLWEVIETTTIEAIKKQKSKLFILNIKGKIKKLKHYLKNIFTKDIFIYKK